MDEISILDYWLMLKRRWLLVLSIFLTTLTISIIPTLRQDATYKAKGQIIFRNANSASSLLGIGAGGNRTESLTNTQVKIILSPPIVQETINTLNLSEEPGSLLSNLQATNLTSTDILEVSYLSENPELAAQIVNTLMDVYINEHIESQRAEAKAARIFLEQELPQVEAKLLQQEKAIIKFKEKYQIVNLSSESQSIEAYLSNLNRERATALARLSSVTAEVRQLQELLGGKLNSLLQVGIVSESPGLQTAIRDLREVQQQLALEQNRFTDNNPAIIDLKSKEATINAILQQRIQESILRTGLTPNQVVEMPSNNSIQNSLLQDFARSEAERIGLEQQLAVLNQLEAVYQQRMTVLPQLEQRQRELERQVTTSQSIYQNLLTRLQEIQLTENQNVGNARVLLPASIPKSPIATRKNQSIIIGGLLGILLGVATAIALETVDRSLKSIEEAKQLLDYPLLGKIPDFEQLAKAKEKYPVKKAVNSFFFPEQETVSPQVITKNNSLSVATEAFRMLQTNLRFTSPDNQLKSVVISSAVSGEGKSTISANLAVVTAELGHKVLIIDADMRQPTQHRIWKLSTQLGLSTVLIGQTEFESALVEVMTNLDVLPAGDCPPNPFMLLDSNQMAVLLGKCAGIYDLIIIDSPPIYVAADTTILGKIANGLIFVVRPGKVKSNELLEAKEILEQSKQNVFGFVANSVETDGSYCNYAYITD